MSQPISAKEQLANIKATMKSKIEDIRVGENTVIHDLDTKVKLDYQSVDAHMTVNLADVQSYLGTNPGTNAQAVADAINGSHYHVTFRTGQDDYDPTNARWYSNTNTWAPKAGNRTDEADAIISAKKGSAVANERDAALDEAAGFKFKPKS